MPTDKARMLAGESYLADDEELVADRDRCRSVLARLNATNMADSETRTAILSGLLGRLGEDAEILSPFHCDYGYQIEVGARTFINFGAVILDSAPVRIGDDVQIGPSVQLATPTHPLDPGERRTHIESSAPITICDDVWLASGVIVCPGVTIGAGTTVGAGSVVIRDLPARHLCLGNPCRPIREV
ncbi:MAG: sugar O-acetyltransferase [Solirubrobacteraceae bacterium]